MEILELFKRQLIEDKSTSSKSTLKNYLSDVRHFISWFEKSTQTQFEAIKINSDILSLYEKTLGGLIQNGNINTSTQLSTASMKRHLSSLRKFFSILEKSSVISINPFTQIQPEVNIEPTDLWHLKSFKDSLQIQRASKITVKNYLSDIAGFARWYEETILPGLEKPLSSTGGFYLINQEILEDYRKRLLEIQNAAPRTVNRKLSALRKYLSFATEKGFVSPNELILDPVRLYEEKRNVLDGPSVELSELPKVAPRPKTYSIIPPVRLLQKLVIFPYLALEEKTATSIASLIAGKPLGGIEKLSPKLASIIEAKNILRANTNSVSNLLGIRNVSKEFYAPDKVSLLGTPLYKRAIYHFRFTRPNWYKKYHNYSFVHYVHFALLVIFASGVGVALYQNLVAKKQLPTFAAATAPPRIISFQGRLTDNLDNPITSTSALRFAIYNDPSASGGALLWQEAITNIVPDQDGIFSILLGGGTQIPSTVFTDNSQIYLGVTVGVTSELTPRQRIASVGYATNAEFLQGQPPTTQAGITSFANVILALDSSGNLTLADSGVTDHTFQVSNGAFNIKGQTLYLTTNSGSGGNVILSPDGLGKNDIQRPIINTTTMGNLVPGGVEINDKFGILATESAVAAFIINNNTSGGDILAASSSGTTRFKIANDGTLTDAFYNTAGGLIYGSNTSGTFAQTTAGLLGQCLQSAAGGTPTWGTCGGNSSPFQELAGAIVPFNSTEDLLVGGQTTASAKFRFINNNTGTPIASISANSTNNATFLSGDGTLGTTNRQTLTIGNSSTYNTTGNLLLNPNGIGKIGIGTTTPLIGFDLRGNSGITPAASISAKTSYATLLVDNSGTGDLIAASASGVPNFVVKNNGDVIVGLDGGGKLTASVIDPYLVQNQKTTGTQSLTFQTLGATNADFVFKNVNTTLSTLTMAGQFQLPITGSTGGIVLGGDTQIFRGAADRLDVASGDSFNVVSGSIQIGGSTVIDSSRNGTFQTLNVTGGCTGCTVGAPSPFQVLNGAIVPLNGTLDLLLGSQATTSAKFAVLNIGNGGTPTASVSATSTGAGLSIAGDGTLQGTLNNNIVIGGNTTGAIQFKPNNNSVSMFLSGANVAIGNQNPQASLDVSQNSHLSSAVDKIIFGSVGNTIGVLGYDGAANDEIRIGAQSNKGLELLTNNTTQAYITNTGNFGINTTSPTAKLDVNGTASISGQLALYSTPTIQSTAFQSLTLGGSTTGDIQFKPGNASTPSLYLQTGGNVGIGTTTPGYALQVVKTSGAAETQPLFLNNRDSTNGSAVSLTFGAVNADTVTGKIMNTRVSGSNYALSFHNFGGAGLFEAARFDSNGNFGIGTTSPTAPLHVNAGKFGGNAAVIVNQTGVSTNDIFAASASGTTKFVIKNDGNASSSAGFTIDGTGALQSTKNQTLTIGGNSTGAIVLSPNNGNGSLRFTNFTTNGGILYTNGAGVLAQTGAGSSLQCLLGDLSWGTCSTGTTTSPFFESAGSIKPFNSTEDFFIGGQATTSAKFSILNVNNGTPTASVSSGLNGTASLYDANGNFQTANKMTLTLGGGNTGNIIIQGNGSTTIVDQTIRLNGVNPTFSANGTSTLTLNNNSTGNIQFFSSSNTITNAGALAIAGSATINGGTVQLANGAQGTIQTTSNADIVITAGSGTINLNTISNGAVLTGSGLTTLGGELTVNGATTTFGNAAPTITTGNNTDLTINPNGTGNLIITSDFNTGVSIGSSSNTPALLSVSGGIGSNAGFILNRVGSTDDIFAASSSGVTKFVIKNDGNASSSAGFTINGTGALQSTNNQTLTIGGSSTGNIVLSPNNGSGNIRFSNFSTNNGLLFTNGSGVLAQTGAGGGTQCLLGNLTWGSCSTGTSGSPFQELLGAIVPNNSTEDFLIGGQATTSAKFAILNISGNGTPTASISAQSANNQALALGADGTIQSVRKNSLTIGGSTTGNITVQGNGILSLADATVNLTGTNPTIGATGSNTLTINGGSTGNIQFFSSSNTLTNGGALTIAGNATINGTVLQIGNGSNSTIQTATNGNLTLTAAGSGNTTLSSDFNSSVFVGNATTPAPLSVSGGIGSNAVFVLNQSNSGDLFAASASGTTKFVIKNDGTASSSAGFTINGAGNIQSTNNQTLTIGGSSTGFINIDSNSGQINLFDNTNINGNLTGLTGLTLASGAITLGGTTGTGSCLLGGASATWGSCGTGGFGSPFRELSGAVVQLNLTEDFLAGGQASTSAAFKVTGQGNPFAGTLVGASVSAKTSFAGLVVDNRGVGDLFTASSSGVPQFVVKNNGNVGIGLGTGTAGIPTAKLDVNGNASISGNLSFRTGVGSIQTSANSTLTIGGNTTGNIVIKSLNTTVFQTPGTANTFIGADAGRINLTGSHNSFFGYQTGYNNTTGSFNFFLGDSAGFANIGGSNNSFIGLQAGVANQTGGNNLFLGNSSGATNIAGGSNTFVGESSGFSNTASFNTFIGNSAGYSNGSGTGNVFIGYLAGDSVNNSNANVTGSNNTFIGYQSGPGTATQLTNATAFGYQSLVSASNSLVLGGTGATAVKVGVGTQSPTGTLDIQGGFWGGNAAFIVNQTGSSNNDIFSASASGVTKFTIGNDGQTRVGNISADPVAAIGAGSIYYNTTSQALKFYNGTSWASIGSGVSSNAFKEALGAIIANQPTEDFILGGNATSSAKFAVLNLSGSGTPTASVSAQNANNQALILGGDGTIQSVRNNTLTIGGNTTGNIILSPQNGSGRVGIGTNSPTAALHLFKTGTNDPLAIFENGSGGSVMFTSANNTIFQKLINVPGNDNFITGSVAGDSGIVFSNTGNYLIGVSAGYVSQYFKNNNTIGLGTNSPISELHVTRPLTYGATGKALAIFDQIENQDILTASASGTTKFVITKGGRVGIGTALPSTTLDVVGGNIRVDTATTFNTPDRWIGVSASNGFAIDSGQGPVFNSSANFLINLDSDNSDNDVRKFIIAKNSDRYSAGETAAGTALFSVEEGGNVGIGLANSPTGLTTQARLHVFSTLGTSPAASISAQNSTDPVLLITSDGSNNGDLFVASVSGQPKFRIDSNGGIHNNGGISNDYGDFAEYYKKANSNETFEAGQLVCIQGNGVVKCTNTSSSQRILGIISDRSFLRGNASHANDPDYVLVGMVGQLGLWVNGDVKAGDPLTISSTPGIATVAKGEGNIIGYAQEGNNNALKRIESVIQPTYFNPNTALQNDNVFASLTIGIQSGVYSVFDAFGNSITHIDAFSKAMIGSLQAGFASIQTLAVNTFTATTSSLGNATASTFAVAANTITIGGQDIRQFIIDTVRNAGFGQGTVVSPIATDTVKTNVLSPLADNSSVQLNANKDNFELKNTDTGKTVAWFNNQGNATISGKLTSDGITTNVATVTGTLAANTVVSNEATVSGTLTAGTIIANNISGLDQKLATLAAALQNSQSSSNSGQTTNNYLASDTIHANFGIFEQGITSMGPVTSNILTATDQLAVGNSFTITNNAINTVGADLQIQSLRQGDIAFEGGLIKMDTDGNMLVSGNLNLLGEIDAVHGVFSGTLTAPALATGLISPLPGDDLAIKLSDSASTSGRLKIINQQNQEVLSINSHGDLNASGSGTFAKLNFSLVGKAEATSLTEAVATGSAGFATLKQGQVELTIKNPIITSKSLIYITPFGDTENKVIYLLRQVPQSEVDDGSFTVGISGTPSPKDVQFNWLVVN